MTEIAFDNGTRIEIFDGCTRITMVGGGTVTAAPEDTPDYRDTAERHGYGDDTLALCKDHELMHLALADWLGTVSPTMEFLTNGTHADMYIRGLEEDAILGCQRYARAIGVDLVELFQRKRGGR